jgi:hypothetical protein
VTVRPPRLTRLALIAVTGATALSVAACGSSNTASPTSSPSTGASSASPNAAAPSTSSAPTPTPGKPEAHVSGLIASVSGNAAQITQGNGNATVDFTGSTTVTEVTLAAFSDVTTGNCVSVRPAHDESQGGQSVTAASVRISPAVNGQCPEGRPSGNGPGPTPPSSSPMPPKHPGVQGTVGSVAGNSITVNGTDGSATSVTVTDKTRYAKQVGSDTQAIAQGKCMTALGTQDGSGALQATTIKLRPANDGRCMGEGGPQHGHGE